MSVPTVQVNFRIPAELKERLEKAAQEGNRSLTAEIVLRLEQTFNLRIGNRVSEDGEKWFMTKDEVMEVVDGVVDRLKRDLIAAGVDLPKKAE